jgi:hypothetical protein
VKSCTAGPIATHPRFLQPSSCTIPDRTLRQAELVRSRGSCNSHLVYRIASFRRPPRLHTRLRWRTVLAASIRPRARLLVIQLSPWISVNKRCPDTVLGRDLVARVSERRPSVKTGLLLSRLLADLQRMDADPSEQLGSTSRAAAFVVTATAASPAAMFGSLLVMVMRDKLTDPG